MEKAARVDGVVAGRVQVDETRLKEALARGDGVPPPAKRSRAAANATVDAPTRAALLRCGSLAAVLLAGIVLIWMVMRMLLASRMDGASSECLTTSLDQTSGNTDRLVIALKEAGLELPGSIDGDTLENTKENRVLCVIHSLENAIGARPPQEVVKVDTPSGAPLLALQETAALMQHFETRCETADLCCPCVARLAWE